jgi:hypothetical protein
MLYALLKSCPEKNLKHLYEDENRKFTVVIFEIFRLKWMELWFKVVPFILIVFNACRVGGVDFWISILIIEFGLAKEF